MLKNQKRMNKYKLSYLYDISSGISTKPDQSGHGCPFLSFSTVFNNIYLTDDLPDLMDTTPKEQETFSIKSGDIFLTRTSETVDELAMSCVALRDYPQATFSGFVKRLRPKTTGIVYDKYMAFLLRSAYFRKIINNNTIMTLRASFNEDIFSFISIYLPEYAEQVRIGDLLFSIEEKIRLNKRINDNLQQLLRLVYDYWFTQFDFPDHRGKPYKSTGGAMVWNSLLKTSIPSGWHVLSLRDVIQHIHTGLNPRQNFVLGKGEIRYVTVKNITINGTLDFKGCDTIDEKARIMIHNRSDIKVGDILFASIAPLGRCYLITENPDDWDINESVFSIRPNNLISSEYLYSILISDRFVQSATNSSTGSIFKGIRINDLMETKVLVPSEDVLEMFSSFARGLLSQISLTCRENESLFDQMDYMLQMLMSGQATIAD